MQMSSPRSFNKRQLQNERATPLIDAIARNSMSAPSKTIGGSGAIPSVQYQNPTYNGPVAAQYQQQAASVYPVAAAPPDGSDPRLLLGPLQSPS